MPPHTPAKMKTTVKSKINRMKGAVTQNTWGGKKKPTTNQQPRGQENKQTQNQQPGS